MNESKCWLGEGLGIGDGDGAGLGDGVEPGTRGWAGVWNANSVANDSSASSETQREIATVTQGDRLAGRRWARNFVNHIALFTVNSVGVEEGEKNTPRENRRKTDRGRKS